MKKESSISRRKVLKTITASGVAVSTSGIATATEEIPDIEIEEVSGSKAKNKIKEAMNMDEWKILKKNYRII